MFKMVDSICYENKQPNKSGDAGIVYEKTKNA